MTKTKDEINILICICTPYPEKKERYLYIGQDSSESNTIIPYTWLGGRPSNK